MTVPGTPLPGTALGGITPPWRVVPAHIVMHIGVFFGTLTTLLFSGKHHNSHFSLVGGPPEGMAYWAWIVWLCLGLSSGPLMASSYWSARRAYRVENGGAIRYLSLWIHIIANACGMAAILIYMYTAAVVGGLLPGWAFGWCIHCAVGIFLIWLVVNDSLRLKQIESLAGTLHDEDVEHQRLSAVDEAADAGKSGDVG